MKSRQGDAFLDLKNEGFWVVERRVDLPAGANHLSTNPADIDAEVGAFAQKQIVGVDQGRGEVIKGGSVGCADVEGRDRRGWRGSGYLGPRIPEEPAEAENGDRSNCGDAGREGDGSLSHSRATSTYLQRASNFAHDFNAAHL